MRRMILTLMAILTICLAQAKVVNTTLQLKNVQSKQKVERVAKSLKGVTNAVYSSKYKTLYVSYDNKKTNVSSIKKGLNNAGYKTATSQKSGSKNNQFKKSNNKTQKTNQKSTKSTSHKNLSTDGSHHNGQQFSGHGSDHR